MLVLNLVAFGGVGYLLILHIYLKYHGLTTYEYILRTKPEALKHLSSSSSNPGEQVSPQKLDLTNDESASVLCVQKPEGAKSLNSIKRY